MSPSPPPWRTTAALIATVLLGACAATPWWQQDLDAWIGASTAELLDAWGPPLRTLSSAEGATVLVFERTRSLDPRIERLAEPGAPLEPGATRQSYIPPQQSDCTLFFDVRDNTVVGIRHEGTACDIVPREPVRRRSDPATGGNR
jgi:hypothetical protein